LNTWTRRSSRIRGAPFTRKPGFFRSLDESVLDLENESDDPDEPEGWKLSDTLYEVLKKARAQKEWNGLSATDLIKKGLKKLSEGLRGMTLAVMTTLTMYSYRFSLSV